MNPMRKPHAVALGFWKPQLLSETLFSACFHVFYTRTNWSRSSQSACDPFVGGIYSSRPVLLFSRGVARFFYGIPTFGEKKQKGFPAIYIDVSSENVAYFSNNSRPKLIVRKLECVDYFHDDILKKLQAALDVSPEIAGRAWRKAGPIRPFPGPNTPAKV